MTVTVEEMKSYLRVDFEDDDSLIENFITAAKKQCMDILRTDEWLDQFGTFSIYQVLPEIIELWGLNVQTQVESKKTSSD